MKRSLLLLLSVLGLSTPISASAQTEIVIAGWDFSQFAGDGFWVIHPSFTFVNTLNANYSNLDPTNNCGTESAQLGTMYANGQFGSTNITTGSGSEPFLPTQGAPGSLSSNISAPVQGFGTNPFDSHSLLELEGQPFTEFLSMTAPGVASIVFKADVSVQAQNYGNWLLTFGGKTFSGTATVTVDFSTNGSSYTSNVGSGNLTTTDVPFSVTLPAAQAETVFVRLNFNPATGQPIIDNVAIEALVVSGVDTDGDTIPDNSDNCPTVANGPGQAGVSGVGNQTNTDSLDALGDACDNCPLVVNPPVAQTGVFTTTGGQPDDDADGAGNACDTKYNKGTVPPTVGSPDATQFVSALGKNPGTVGLACGTKGDECICFNADGKNSAPFTIGSPDATVFVGSLGKVPTACPSCGPPYPNAALPCVGPACPGGSNVRSCATAVP